MLEGKTCVVAGASGFLGGRLATLLAENGVAVRALVRESSVVNLPPTVPIFRCAFSDSDGLAQAFDGANILFNCAGHSSDWGPWKDFQEGNIDSVDHLCRAAALAGIGRLLHVSTTDVYGYPQVACDETHPLIDVGLPYNRSKIAGDRLARSLGKELGLEVAVIRPATIFGPRSHDWVVELSRELKAERVPLLKHGQTNAGLVLVDDVAQAMIELAAAPRLDGDAYNVVDPTPITWQSYFTTLCEVVGSRPPHLNLPVSLAVSTAYASEAVWRVLAIKSRPLFTRQVVYVMSRDQHYHVKKLQQAITNFPAIGLVRGIELTRAWLASESGSGVS